MYRAIRLVYSKDYAVDTGNHVFPTSNYNLIKVRLLKESGLGPHLEFVRPGSASDDDILSVNTFKALL